VIGLLIAVVYMVGMGGCLQVLLNHMKVRDDALIEEEGFAWLLSTIWFVVLFGYLGWVGSKRFFGKGKGKDEVKS
jgi:hypothetical protein